MDPLLVKITDGQLYAAIDAMRELAAVLEHQPTVAYSPGGRRLPPGQQDGGWEWLNTDGRETIATDLKPLHDALLRCIDERGKA